MSTPASPLATPHGDLRSPRAWHLGFAPDVEARYEADTGAQRSRDLQLAGLVALCVYDLFLVNDWLIRPEVLSVAMFWRLGVVSVYGLLMLALIRRGLPPRWREAAMGSTIVVAMWGSSMIFRATASDVGVYDPFMFSLVFLACNIVFQLRFVVALTSSTTALLIAAAHVLAPGAMPDAAKPFALALLLATLIFTVLACYRLERSERRAYLLILRETSRSQAAMLTAGQMATLSQTDALTQLANRRAFDLELPRRLDEARRTGQPLAMLVIDIDHFKRYNDHYGHPAGDACLRRVAEVMREALREQDFIARIGGEEFAVLLSPANPATARQLADRLLQQVEQAAIAHEGLPGRQVVTISLGLAVTALPQAGEPASLMAAADAALYDAKRQGRNRWVMAPNAAAAVN
ncbi:MAG: GGDEF domain-containing protein [Burkholderiales bacterium]|nr:GGDEF domain-containing protein [Burkholderiales bacterium]